MEFVADESILFKAAKLKFQHFFCSLINRMFNYFVEQC